jgi:hypothetical protein
VSGQPGNRAVTEFTVLQVNPAGTEEPLSSGHFEVGTEYSKIVFWPTEDAARTAAIEYARKLVTADFRHRFIVRRTETQVVWDGDLP